MRRATLLLAFFGLLLACHDGGEEPVYTPDPASLRALEDGAVVGFAHAEDTHAWLGIPFAQPPRGDLRWRAPLPAQPWQGTREALSFGPSCPQIAGRAGGVRDAEQGEPAGSEDCLYLNVYAPRFEAAAVPGAGQRLPVMVWIHGGGNTVGTARSYDGARLAASRGVVVVTVQYRLGVFGWLSHPALRVDAASVDDASGNYGTLDLVRALSWVRENVAAFGGDPQRVTVFGESAGGWNVFSLLLSPRARGLFQRAIVQSGGLSSFSLPEAEGFADDPEPGHENSSRELLLSLLQRDGRADGREGAREALAGMSNAEVAAYLRGQTSGALLRLFDGERLGGMYDAPRLIRDGRVLPGEEPLEALRAGAYNRVPVILGTNRDENKLFLAFGSPHVARFMGLPLRIKNARLYELEAEYAALLWKAGGVDEPATAMRKVQGPSVFAYRFDWDAEPRVLWMDLSRLLGAAHAFEIPFVFGDLSFFGARFLFDGDHRQQDVQLSRAMTSYWTQFAATGDPGRGRDGELPRWAPWALGDGHRYVLLDTEDDGGIRMASEPTTRAEVIARVATDPRFESPAERCAVWASFVEWTRDMSAEEYAAAGDGMCANHPLEAGG